MTYSNDPNTKKVWKVAFSALQDSCNAGDLSIQEAFTSLMQLKNNSITFASLQNLTKEIRSFVKDCILIHLMSTDTFGQPMYCVSLFFFFKVFYFLRKKTFVLSF